MGHQMNEYSSILPGDTNDLHQGRGRVQRWCPLGSVSRVHLSRPLGVCQARRLTLRPKLQEKQIGLLHRKTWGVYQSAICTVPGVAASQELSSFVTVLWDPE